MRWQRCRAGSPSGRSLLAPRVVLMPIPALAAAERVTPPVSTSRPSRATSTRRTLAFWLASTRCTPGDAVVCLDIPRALAQDRVEMLALTRNDPIELSSI
jgi:hypothetical protein